MGLSVLGSQVKWTLIRSESIAEEVTGDRCGASGDLFGRALDDHLTSSLGRTGSEVDDIIRRFDHL